MNEKMKQQILHDLNAIFDNIVYELCRKNEIEVHLAENTFITQYDMPHLLTLSTLSNDIRIFIFVVKLGQLGIRVKS